MPTHQMISFEGSNGRNDVLLTLPSTSSSPRGITLFFPGDCQDMRTAMEGHRDNARHVDYCYERTADHLLGQFPLNLQLIVRPSYMHVATFAAYKNFTNCNQIGTPDFSREHPGRVNPWAHLCKLVENVLASAKLPDTRLPVTLIGFSKGCVVLNQLMYSLQDVDMKDGSPISTLIGRITDIYWLDGGHSGPKETWLTQPNVALAMKAKLRADLSLHIRVTSYQIGDLSAPWKKAQEKAFQRILREAGFAVDRKVLFANEERDIEQHFAVLRDFK